MVIQWGISWDVSGHPWRNSLQILLLCGWQGLHPAWHDHLVGQVSRLRHARVEADGQGNQQRSMGSNHVPHLQLHHAMVRLFMSLSCLSYMILYKFMNGSALQFGARADRDRGSRLTPRCSWSCGYLQHSWQTQGYPYQHDQPTSETQFTIGLGLFAHLLFELDYSLACGHGWGKQIFNQSSVYGQLNYLSYTTGKGALSLPATEEYLRWLKKWLASNSMILTHIF